MEDLDGAKGFYVATAGALLLKTVLAIVHTHMHLVKMTISLVASIV